MIRRNEMVSIPKHVQDFLTGKMGWVATASKAGLPNVTPKGSLKLLDEQHVVFADLFSCKTRQNLMENPQAAVTVIDLATAKGYQIKGKAECLTSGPLFDEMAKQLKGSPNKLPPLQYLVKITVEAVYDQSVGPDAGKQIA
jgi:predicted pyridoxine 5'-phosphate oxidase superfamily flavin-nucleotide-binding protein